MSLMFHVSHPANRTSILEHGLDHELGDQNPDWFDEEYPEGIYLFPDATDAQAYSEAGKHDIFTVEVDGLVLEDDPLGPYKMTQQVIEPARVTLSQAATWWSE